jgi:hypothetical protein
MYSPKIREEYIPTLYRLAKLKRITMTRLVNGVIEDYLNEVEAAARQLKAKEITREIFKKRGWKTGEESVPAKQA